MLDTEGQEILQQQLSKFACILIWVGLRLVSLTSGEEADSFKQKKLQPIII